MVNFDKIFEKSGFEGIIPIAFNRDGDGYRYLLDKFLDSKEVYLIVSDATSEAFVKLSALGVSALIFSDSAIADSVVASVSTEGCVVHAEKLLINKDDKLKFLRHLDFLGFDSVEFNSGPVIPLTDFVDTLPEGIVSPSDINPPVENKALIRAFLALKQESVGGHVNAELANYTMDVLRRSKFLVPSVANGGINDSLCAEDIQIPVIDFNGHPTVLMMTTLDGCAAVQAKYPELEVLTNDLFTVHDYTAIRDILHASDGCRVIIDPQSYGWVFTKDGFEWWVDQVHVAPLVDTNEVEVDTDPCPDWLR